MNDQDPSLRSESRRIPRRRFISGLGLAIASSPLVLWSGLESWKLMFGENGMLDRWLEGRELQQQAGDTYLPPLSLEQRRLQTVKAFSPSKNTAAERRELRMTMDAAQRVVEHLQTTSALDPELKIQTLVTNVTRHGSIMVDKSGIFLTSRDMSADVKSVRSEPRRTLGGVRLLDSGRLLQISSVMYDPVSKFSLLFAPTGEEPGLVPGIELSAAQLRAGESVKHFGITGYETGLLFASTGEVLPVEKRTYPASGPTQRGVYKMEPIQTGGVVVSLDKGTVVGWVNSPIANFTVKHERGRFEDGETTTIGFDKNEGYTGSRIDLITPFGQVTQADIVHPTI